MMSNFLFGEIDLSLLDSRTTSDDYIVVSSGAGGSKGLNTTTIFDTKNKIVYTINSISGDLIVKNRYEKKYLKDF